MGMMGISSLWGKIAVLFVICCFITVCLCGNTASALDGSGTEENPWRIQSLEDFNEFAADANYWDDYTQLETDVNLAGMVYDRAVIAWDEDNSNYYFDGTFFTGVFDGNNRKIVNLTINDVGVDNHFLGLFGYIGEEGEIRNLGIEGGSVNGRYYIGGLAGSNFGIISNCYATGSVSGRSCVGGLVGENHDEVLNSHSIGNVSGPAHVGGLVGINNYNGSLSNCYAAGDVNGISEIGGLVGINGGNISNCYSTGDVKVMDWFAGGLVGQNWGIISDCYSTSDVNGVEYVGGLLGSNSGGGFVTKCHYSGDVNGYCHVSSLVGSNSGIISNCLSSGNASGYIRVGGLVGENSDDGITSNCYSFSDVNGVRWVGGLVGLNRGFVTKCNYTGNINGEDCIAGLVGWNRDGSISNCYSTGDVNGINLVGGLVGKNGLILPSDLYPGYINNSYSTSNVQGDSNVGGLVGYNELGDIEKSYWDIETSGEPNMCGNPEDPNCENSCGRTTAQMHQQTTFENWDFVNVWGIGENQTYPYLRRYLAGDINKDGIVNFKDFAFIALQWLEEYNAGNERPEVVITYPEDGERLMVGGVPPQTMIMAEADDYDGTVVRVEFFDNEMKLGEDTDGSDGWSYLWAGYSLGWHTLTAVAWDEEELSGTSAAVTVEVWMPDPPPP